MYTRYVTVFCLDKFLQLSIQIHTKHLYKVVNNCVKHVDQYKLQKKR